MKKIWQEWRGTLGFLLLMLVFRSAIADWNYIPSSSMNPTLVAGDRVGVNKLAYGLRIPFTHTHLTRWADPQRGDVITFDSPRDEVNLIKRVVAVAGDEISMWDNQLIINGKAVPRRWLAEREISTENGTLQMQVWIEKLPSATGTVTHELAQWPERNILRSFKPVIVPEGQVLVLGDSRDNSNDSRFIGVIDRDRITGRAERVVMSHDPENFYVPRAQRWWLPLHI